MYGWEGILAGDGPMLMLSGMLVVFTALMLLLLMMKGLKKYQDSVHARRRAREEAAKRAATAAAGTEEPGIRAIEAPDGHDISGVEIAAIALTLLFEQEQVHDNESMVLTLQGLPKPYSNWWQGRIDPAWKARVTPGRPASMQIQDPERGTRV